MKKIPSLDGLRAVSILMVVLLHTLQRVNVTHPVGKYWFLLGNGGTGVYIFFVISGYLITTLLVREYLASDHINLRKFYIRRVFRILPPVYFYVAVVIALSWFSGEHIAKRDVIAALFFSGNYVPLTWALNHFWTLSIEEQFYLIWPAVLLVCLRYGGRNLAAKVAGAVILVCPVVRVLTHFCGGAYLRGVNGVSFQGRADALMFGCLVALVAGADPFERLFRSCARVWWVFPAVLVVGSGILEVRFGDYWDFPIGYTVNGVCIAFFLLWCVRNPGSTVGRVLNTKLMSYLGVLSYSTYIWQQLFLNIHNSSIFGDTVLEKLPVCLVLVVVGSCFSYYIVERPSLRLRDRVERRVGGLRRRLDPEIVAD